MLSCINNDLDIFLKDFGTTVSYNDTEILGIFDDSYTTINMTGQVEMTSPAIMVKSSDVDGITHGEVISINSTDYYVTSIQPNGSGFVSLELSKEYR
jgi:hypothetical protein